MYRIAALVLPFMLGGCFLTRGTVNEPISAEAVAGLEVGTSTTTDVLEALGAPLDVVQLGRKSAWRYDFTTLKRAALFAVVIGFLNEDSRQDRVWVFFDEEGVLRDLGSTFEGKEPVYAMPWVEIHE
jgi:outer membrane protein assembly factor BamE (lipoprotein component of BamABCDE complex)